jgi:hypothetical protein
MKHMDERLALKHPLLLYYTHTYLCYEFKSKRFGTQWMLLAGCHFAGGWTCPCMCMVLV